MRILFACMCRCVCVLNLKTFNARQSEIIFLGCGLMVPNCVSPLYKCRLAVQQIHSMLLNSSAFKACPPP